jgi:hypothetical protein
MIFIYISQKRFNFGVFLCHPKISHCQLPAPSIPSVAFWK